MINPASLPSDYTVTGGCSAIAVGLSRFAAAASYRELRLAAAIVLLTGGLFFSDCAVADRPTPLSSSVLLLDARRLDRGVSMVDRAAKTGGGRLQIVVNLHVRLTEDLRVRQFGMLIDRSKSWRDPRNFWPMDQAMRAEFRDALTLIFARAANLGMDIAILPHLDAAGDVQEWRNHFDFDPIELSGGFSYQTAMIAPLIDAIRPLRSETRVWFALSGEMGRSLFQYPAAYRQLMDDIRQGLPSRQVEVGVSLNHNDVGGDQVLSDNQQASMQLLLNKCDFVGFSCYRPFRLPPTANTFRMSCQKFRHELQRHRLSLPTSTAIHLSEIGLGGAPPRRGSPTPDLAAQAPWEGSAHGPINPWASGDMQSLRRGYYAALLEFLASEPITDRPQAAFLWSEGSWEPLGVDRPLFADPQIAAEIAHHNRHATNGSRVPQALPPRRP